jgi:hypothetical protein
VPSPNRKTTCKGTILLERLEIYSLRDLDNLYTETMYDFFRTFRFEAIAECRYGQKQQETLGEKNVSIPIFSLDLGESRDT